MVKILLLERSPQLVWLYSLNLKIYLAANVTIIQNPILAKPQLKKPSQYELIIINAEFDPASKIDTVVSEIVSKSPYTKVLVIGASHLKGETMASIEKPELKDVVRHSAQLLSITAAQMAEQQVPEFFPIPLQYFIAAVPNPCEIFMAEQNVFGKAKLKQLLPVNEAFKKSQLKKLSSQGIEYLFIPSKSRIKFVNNMSERLIKKLKDKKMTTSERLAVTESSTIIVLEMVKGMGLPDDAIHIANASIDSIKEVVNMEKDVGSLISKLMEDELSFRFKHCQMITFLTTHIIREMEWGTVEQQDKLAFVAFFHDVALETDKLAMIHTQEELEAADLTPEEYRIVEEHAKEGARYLSYFKKVPMGVDVLIKQHHGVRNGVGFKNVVQNLSPLAVVFVLAEHWTHLVLKAAEKKVKLNKDDIIMELEAQYPGIAYKRVIEVLRKLNI